MRAEFNQAVLLLGPVELAYGYSQLQRMASLMCLEDTVPGWGTGLTKWGTSLHHPVGQLRLIPLAAIMEFSRER